MTEHSLKLARWQKLAEIALTVDWDAIRRKLLPELAKTLKFNRLVSSDYDRAFMEWYAKNR